MEDSEALKAEIRKLNARATQLKMDLHDLSEELPIGWERIPELAEKTHQAFQNLALARQKLAR